MIVNFLIGFGAVIQRSMPCNKRDNVGASECNSLSYMRESKFKDWGLTLRLSSSMSKK
jgi:hypothetical protein